VLLLLLFGCLWMLIAITRRQGLVEPTEIRDISVVFPGRITLSQSVAISPSSSSSSLTLYLLCSSLSLSDVQSSFLVCLACCIFPQSYSHAISCQHCTVLCVWIYLCMTMGEIAREDVASAAAGYRDHCVFVFGDSRGGETNGTPSFLPRGARVS
jgi:hypothetical protein